MVRGSVSVRGRLLAVVTAAIAVSGLALAPMTAPPAEALGCTLGPSLASAARAVGISCPQVDGIDQASQWGPAGGPAGACNFGWESSNYPPGLMEYLTATMASRINYTSTDGDQLSWTLYRRAGKTAGGILVRTRPDRTFTVLVDVRGRSGYTLESVYFDCQTSSDGPMYTASVPSDADPLAGPLPVIGAPPASPVSGPVVAAGSMSTLGRSNHLLRIDVTNTAPEAKPVSVDLDLAGYAVDSFATKPADARCVAAEGLVCAIDSVLPGQTRSFVLVLHDEGAADAAAQVDVAVSSLAMRPLKSSVGSPRVNRIASTTDSYTLGRP
jgi:hypothetical protein